MFTKQHQLHQRIRKLHQFPQLEQSVYSKLEQHTTPRTLNYTNYIVHQVSLFFEIKK